MKKKATYISDTPIKESSQAAGFLHEDLRALDHEESWVLFRNAANIPLTKKIITVGTITTLIEQRFKIITVSVNIADAYDTVLLGQCEFYSSH